MKKLFTILILTILHINTAGMDFDKEKTLPINYIPAANANTPQSPQSMIKTISNELNAHIPQGILFPKSPRELTAQEYQSLIERVERICPSITDPSIIELVQKNSYFHASLCHFITIALKNLEQVTCATLDTVRDSRNQQPTPELNILSPALKKYVMDYAYSEIKNKHTIEFKGHENHVCNVDIKTPYAASTCSNGICKVWNIHTGKELYTLPTISKYSWIKFNQSGSLLATLLNQPKKLMEPTTIHIWKIHSSISPQEPFYKITHSNISNLVFLGDNLLCVFESGDMTEYKLKKDGTFTNLGNITCKYIANSLEYNICGNKNNWSLIKNSPLLYLCRQAILNTKLNTAVHSITKTDGYKELWKHEQNTLKEYAKTTREITLQ